MEWGGDLGRVGRLYVSSSCRYIYKEADCYNWKQKIVMIVYPNAKINIGLHVVERRPDGYHNLETVFYPIQLQDALEVESGEGGAGCDLRVSGLLLGGSPDDNLVVRAYRLLLRDFPDRMQRVQAHLFKHVPTGAGLGGGSSDGAFMLKVLNARFSLGLSLERLEAYAAQLGADCPFFIRNEAVLARGIGNEFSPVRLSLAGKMLVLVKPDVFVSTADAYRLVVPRRPEQSLETVLQRPVAEWKDVVVNDFEASVFPKYPEIAAIKDRLYDLGALYASMSGSGSAVYGIFERPVDHVDEIFAGYFCRQRELS